MTHLRLLETLFSLSLQVGLLAAATLLCDYGLCRSHRGRDRLWTGCLLAILLLFVGDFCLPHLRLLPVPAEYVDPTLGMSIERHTQAVYWLIVLWLVGVLVNLGRIAAGLVRATGLLYRSTTIPPEQLPAPWGRLPAIRAADHWAHSANGVQFLATSEVISPFCWQFHRPTIVLPEVVLGFSADEIAAVIRHELAHLRYGHALWLFVQRLIEAVMWFHPVVRWVARRASQTREFLCDERAVTSRTEAEFLLRSLLRLTELAGRRAGFRLASKVVGDASGMLAERARRLSAVSADVRDIQCGAVWVLAPAGIGIAAMLLLWIPIDVAASARSAWSPWPTWSARALQAAGIFVRDYEIDGHRLAPHSHEAG